MKTIFWVLVALPLFTLAQKPVATSAVEVKGEIKSAFTFSIEDLKKLKEHTIGDLTITNHLGEKKSEAKALKGVLLKEVLQTVEITAPSPRQLSEYFLVCKASDGYAVVYSWNELFNSPSGEAIFVVTQKEGKPAAEMTESILLVAPKDYKTGRRYLKSLASITIFRAP